MPFKNWDFSLILATFSATLLATFFATFFATFSATFFATFFSRLKLHIDWLLIKLKLVHVVGTGRADHNDHDDFLHIQRHFYSKFFHRSCHARVLTGKSRC